jgi:hypothetical protein
MDEGDPRSLEELETRFATEAACLAHLAAMRWPDGFVGPVPGKGLKATSPAATDDDLDAWDNHKI